MMDWSVETIHYFAINLQMQIMYALSKYSTSINILCYGWRSQNRNSRQRKKLIRMSENDSIMQKGKFATTSMAREEASYQDIETLLFD